MTAAMNLKDACSLEETLWQSRQYNKKQRHYFIDKGLSHQSYGFPSSQVRMWDLGHKEGWMPKDRWFQNSGVGEESWGLDGK